MKELYVNSDACIGCGACIATDPEHFDFNDEGLSEVISNQNIETDDCHNAVDSCPTSAISYVEKNKDEDEDSSNDCECDNCECKDCNCDDCECEDCSGETCECNA